MFTKEKEVDSMNIYEAKVLNFLKKNKFVSQRKMAKELSCSIGTINNSLKSLFNLNYIDSKYRLTQNAFEVFHKSKPKNAVILAAGFGMRMVPINTSVQKFLKQTKLN